MRRPERCGVTLMELMVGLVVAGIVLATAARALVAVDGAGQAPREAARLADIAGNGQRALRELVSQIEPVSDSSLQFSGNETQVSFQSWCRAPGGWSERCLVSLEVRGNALFGVLSTGESLPLVHGQQYVQLRYLNGEGGLGGSWLKVWGAGILVPFALGVLMDGDTIVVRIGERG